MEIVRRYYEAWLRRDPSEMGTLDPEIELHPDPENEWVGLNDVYRGPDGVRDYLRTVEEAVEDYHREVERLIDAGDKVVTSQWRAGAGEEAGLRCSRLERHTSGPCETAGRSGSISTTTAPRPSSRGAGGVDDA